MTSKCRTVGGYKKDKTKSAMKRNKGISPVIATVILIAVAVAIGLAVAFWASGLTGTLTRYEKLEINVAYADYTATGDWSVTIQGRNTGSSDATMTLITFNGRPLPADIDATRTDTGIVSVIVDTTPDVDDMLPTPVGTGKTFAIVINIDSTVALSGQTIEIALVTATGTSYPKAIVLP